MGYATANPSGRWVSCFNPTYVYLIFNSTHLLKSGIVWLLSSELIRIAKNYQKTGHNFGERSLQLNYKGKEEQA